MFFLNDPYITAYCSMIIFHGADAEIAVFLSAPSEEEAGTPERCAGEVSPESLPLSDKTTLVSINNPSQLSFCPITV